ncbi:hypothetical protein EYF80_003222 [Liparis tanakae]|uniref:Uncharacterized protein n=1 Tax=Liparis tanakae TaxID=230148 RepID=A0A4Z2JAM9_9TELE|nr:hypothetical protein EYF80_003222 [Liparis tanakae]
MHHHHQMQKPGWPSTSNSENTNGNWNNTMDASQYPGYPSQYWYPQSHPTGHYANSYPSGSDVQPQYNQQVIQMATVSTPHRKVNIQQAVSTHPTLSTALTLRDRLQVLILTRFVLRSRAAGRLGSHTLNIITILVHTVKGFLDILLGHTLTTVKVVMQCLQPPHTPLASLSTQTLRPMLGGTLVHMHPHSRNGRQVSSLHKTTTEILSAHHILQHGQGLEVVLLPRTNPRSNSTNVLHKWDLNPGQPHPSIPPSLLK